MSFEDRYVSIPKADYDEAIRMLETMVVDNSSFRAAERAEKVRRLLLSPRKKRTIGHANSKH